MSKPTTTYLETINRSLALPSNLKTDDGRRLHVTSWETEFRPGQPIRVTLTAIVLLDK